MELKLKRDGGFKLFVDGQEAKRVGSGRDRTVFKIPGLDLVAKVDDGFAHQATREWEAYRKITDPEHRKLVARIYKPKRVKADDGKKYHVTLQKMVKGGTVCEYTGEVRGKGFHEINEIFRTKYGIKDLHDENIMVTKKGKLKVVDLGITD